MKDLLTAAAVVALALAPVGCGNKSPEGGTPGTKDSFTISAPSGTGSSMTAPTIKQDTRQTIELTVKANSEFGGKKVTLKTEAPKGLHATVKPETVDLAAGHEAKVQLEVHADKDAPVGEATIKVSGTPEKGNPTTDNVKVKVEANTVSGDNNKDRFTLSQPTGLSTLTGKTIKKEATETVELTLKGDSGFTGKKVALKTEHGDKIKAELAPNSVDLGANQEQKVQLKITPAKDCPPGEHVVRVTATPDHGTATSTEVRVKVE